MAAGSRIVIEDRPPSWNEYWSGMHWARRVKEKNRIRMEVLAALGTTDLTPFARPVLLTFTVYQKGPWKDWDNVCVKPYQDALIGLLLEDDGPDYVAGGCIRVVKSDRDRMVIEIEEVE